jgi:small-conductance mechanosensitive channel
MTFAEWWEGLGFWTVPIEVVAIIIGAIIIRLILQLVIKGFVHRVVHRVKKKQGVEDTQAIQASPLAAVRTVQRTRALGGVLSSAVTTVVVLVSVLLIIGVIAPNAAGAFALVTAALGAGLGFGAQNVVKDTLNGIFMVSEDQLGVGDVVDLGPATGVVEYVGIRITDLRDVNGTLWHVRNGEIVRVGNLSQGWARVIIDLAVPYDSDIDAVEERMLETAVGLQHDPKWRRLILEKPEIWGIESISAEAIIVRLVVKTRSGSKDDVARELRMRLKRALDELGVRLPALNTITLSGVDGATSVRGARPPKTAQVAVQKLVEKAVEKQPVEKQPAEKPAPTKPAAKTPAAKPAPRPRTRAPKDEA